MSHTISSRPELPVEVIENVIDVSHDDSEALKLLSLCCRTLLTRSRLLLFSGIVIRTTDQMQSLEIFLDARPWLCPLIQRIVVSPELPGLARYDLLAVFPFQIFRRLPNVHHWTLADPWTLYDEGSGGFTLNNFLLTMFRSISPCIQSLTLEGRFSSCADVGRLLLSFPNIRTLHCLIAIGRRTPRATDSLIQLRLVGCLCLSSLRIDQYTDSETLAVFLLEASQATVVHLHISIRIAKPYEATIKALAICEFPQLKSLSIQIRVDQKPIIEDRSPLVRGIIAALSIPRRALVADITFSATLPADLYYFLSLSITPNTLIALQDIILRSPMKTSSVLCLRCDRWNSRNHDTYRGRFWISKIEEKFPELRKQNLLHVQCPWESISHVEYPIAHEGPVTKLVASPDGKWFASGSDDSTIFVWDAQRHTIKWDWIAHHWCVNDLVFSPDSRYILSVGGDITPKIWDLNADAHLVDILNGHTNVVRCCSWAKSGVLATGSDDGTVRVWDRRNTRNGGFHQRYVLTDPSRAPAGVLSLQFSPNATWLLAFHSAKDNLDEARYVCAWDLRAESGPFHKELCRQSSALVNAAFGLDGRGIVTASQDGKVTLWDLETGMATRAVSIKPLPRYDLAGYNIGFYSGGSILIYERHGEMVESWDSKGDNVISLDDNSVHRNASFSSDGQYVASVSAKGEVRLLRTSNGSCVRVFRGYGSTEAGLFLTFSGNGRVLAIGGVKGNVRLYQLGFLL